MNRAKIAAIDVGTAKVCTVMADTDGAGDLRILGVGAAASRGLEKGLVANVRDAAASISQSVKKAEKMAGYRLKSACVSVSGTDTTSLNNRGVVSISRDDELVHNADRKRALEVARGVEMPAEQRLLHVIPRYYTLDGQRNIKDPVGMYGFRLHVETHTVTADTMAVQNLTRCVRNLGVAVEGLVLESLASAEAVLTEDERQDGVLLADIGGATTDIAVFKDGSVNHTSSLPVGGYQITNDIVVGLGLPFELAEEMKRKHGNAMPSGEEVADDVTVGGNGHSVSYRDLCDIINARVEELFRLILCQMPQTDFGVAIPSGLVLTGGSSNLAGIAELGQRVTRLPVRVGLPLSLDETLRDPAYATGLGLVCWRARNHGVEDPWPSRGGLHFLLPRFLGNIGGGN